MSNWAYWEVLVSISAKYNQKEVCEILLNNPFEGTSVDLLNSAQEGPALLWIHRTVQEIMGTKSNIAISAATKRTNFQLLL